MPQAKDLNQLRLYLDSRVEDAQGGRIDGQEGSNSDEHQENSSTSRRLNNVSVVESRGLLDNQVDSGIRQPASWSGSTSPATWTENLLRQSSINPAPASSEESDALHFNRMRRLFNNCEGPTDPFSRPSDPRLAHLLENWESPGAPDWRVMPQELLTLRDNPGSINTLLNSNPDLIRDLPQRDRLLFYVFSKQPSLVEPICKEFLLSNQLYFLLLNYLLIDPNQIPPSALPSDLLQLAGIVNSAMNMIGAKVKVEPRVADIVYEPMSNVIDTDSPSHKRKSASQEMGAASKRQRENASLTSAMYFLISDENVLGGLSEKGRPLDREDQASLNSVNDNVSRRDPSANLIGKEVIITDGIDEGAISDLDSSSGNESVRNEGRLLTSRRRFNFRRFAKKNPSDDRIQTLLRGINTKYVLGERNAQYQFNRALAQKFLPGVERVDLLSTVPSILDITSAPDRIEDMSVVEFNSALSLYQQSTLIPVEDLYQKRIFFGHEKRSYVGSNEVRVITPEIDGKLSAENPSGGFPQQPHINFVMASREKSGVFLPGRDLHPALAQLTNYLVLTESQLQQEWGNTLPQGVGAVVLPEVDDSGINHRRFAFLLSICWVIETFSADIVSFHDDNVKSLRGFIESIMRLIEIFADLPDVKDDADHHIFCFPNRNQKKQTTYSSGKALLSDAGLFKYLKNYATPESERDQSEFRDGIDPVKGIPVENLFYNDLWMIDFLKSLPESFERRAALEIGGDLLKSSDQKHASLMNLTIQGVPPAQAWVNLDADRLNYADESDKARFKKLQNHIINCAETIQKADLELDREMQEFVFNKPLPELMRIVGKASVDRKVNGFSKLRDYQWFITDTLDEEMEEIDYSKKGSSHIALIMATSTGKTVTFLDRAIAYLDNPQVNKQSCLVVVSRIENAKDIFAKSQAQDRLRDRSVLVCSDDGALDGELLVRSKTFEKSSLLVIVVKNSLEGILEKCPNILKEFGMFVFDESHQFSPKLMQHFVDRKNNSQEHLVFLQASATPAISHLRPGFLGDTLYVANYSVDTAEQRGHVRKVEYHAESPKYVNRINRDLQTTDGLNKGAKQVAKLIFKKLDGLPEYKEIGCRVVCYVKSRKLADECARYIADHYSKDRPNIVASAYHSDDVDTDAVFDQFNQALEPGDIRIIIAVDMFKQAIDPPDGVDVILQLQTAYPSSRDITQENGRLLRFRKGCSANAHLFNFSHRHEEIFFHQKDEMKEYGYGGSVVAKIVIKSVLSDVRDSSVEYYVDQH